MADAALDPARSAAVAASAGTGKTWLLAARITRLLLAGAPPGGILALTFTRKAAAEMQARVTHRLRALALDDETEVRRQLKDIGLEPTPALIERARGLYEQLLFTPWALRASTIHSFCQELVTRFALQTGTTPGFELSEDEEVLLQAAWQRLQRELLRQPEGTPAQALAQLIADGRGESALRALTLDFLRRRNDWRAYAGDTGDAPAQLAQRLQGQLGVRADEELLAAVDSGALNARLRMLCSHLQTAGGGIDRLKQATLEPIFQLQGAARMEALWAAFFTQQNEPRKFKVGDAKRRALGSGAADHCLQIYGELQHELQHVRERQLRQQTLRSTLAGVTLGVAALNAFERELQERAVLCFPELEWRAWQLLRGADTAAWVQYRLDARIEHLLVDEFQDTSDTQWQLLLPLLQEMASGTGERPRSTFIVGDGKQSIYGFRRANPQLLAVAGDYVGSALGGARSELSKSWRSAPAVIDFVNALFGQDELRARLPQFPRHATARTELWGGVELAPLVAATREDSVAEAFRNPLTTTRPDPENRRAHDEGLLIARRIRELIDGCWPVADSGGARAIGYGDIMILLRKRTHQAALEKALAEHQIPFVGSARGTLLHTVEGRDLLALLRFLASPVRDLDLAHALRSSLFALIDDDLAALARAARPQRSGWWPTLAQQQGERWQRAQSLLARWLPLARRLPAHDLIDRILCDSDAVARYEAALPPAQAQRARANLEACAQLALSVDSGRYPSLARFLRQIETAASPDEAPPPADGGAVRILTIHGAKGLEAPVVFLAQAACGASSDGAGWLVHWPPGAERPLELLLAGSREQRDSYSAQLLQAQDARAASEDLNLLYVACTRARQLLHISGFELRGGGDWHALAQPAMRALGATEDATGWRYARGTLPAASTTPAQRTPEPAVDPRLREPLNLRRGAARTPSAQESGDVDPAVARRGIAVHWLLQQLSEGAEQTLRERLEARLMQTVATRDFDSWLGEARAVIAAQPLRHLFDRSQLKRAWNEVPLHNGEQHGVIDRLVDDGETLWLLDYKSERGHGDAELLQRHCAQLRAYREGLQRLWPQRRLRSGLVLTATQRWLELD